MNFVSIASWAVPVLAFAAGIVVYIRAKSQGALAMPAICGAYDLAAGSFMFIFSVIHLIAILSQPFTGKSGRGETFEYNFRFYSLIIIGVLLAVPAFLCFRSARGLIWQASDSWNRAVRWSIVLLAVNIPLIPIQGFAVGFTAFTAVNLSLLFTSRKYFILEKSL